MVASRTRELKRELWAGYFRVHASQISASRAAIQILDPERDKVTLTWDEPLRGVVLGPRGLVIDGLQLEHIVEEPVAISVKESPARELEAFEVVDGRGIRHVVTLRRVLALGV